jgi:hypothetical protein
VCRHQCADIVVLIADDRSLILDGAIAQLGERLLCKQEVVGSIPSGSTRSAVGRHAWMQPALMQPALLLSSVSCALPRAVRGSSRSIVFAPDQVRLVGCVLSDIVKRRSLRALPWMKIQDGAQNLPVLARERVIAIPRVSAALQRWRGLRAVQICR